MECQTNREKKKLVLFRNVIDSLLSLEDCMLERHGEVARELAERMGQLYSQTNSMIGQQLHENEAVQILEEVLTILKEDREEKTKVKAKQVMPPITVQRQENMIGETEIFHHENKVYQENSMETTLLHAPMRLPFLIRESTKEKILINRDVFKIGKEKSYVDYYVDNDAVSRSHADIIRQKDSFFVVDHNSLNHTFVEGKKIPSKQYIRLESGQSFLLADEAFTFYYEAIGDKL